MGNEMTDIVALLRKEAGAWPFIGDMMTEAANEIERMQKTESEALSRMWHAGYNAAMHDASNRAIQRNAFVLADEILTMRRSYGE